MKYNKVYDKEYLAKLGITPDTNPNDPSTWSEDLKKRHSNTVSSLPQEVQKRVKVSPIVEPDGDLQAEVVGNNWKDNISKKYDSLVEQSQARYEGDGEDGRPGKVDPKEWGKLTADQKKAVVEFVRSKRFHDLVRQPENLDVHGAIHYDHEIFHGVRPRIYIESAFYPLNAKIKTDAQKAEKAAAHKKARDIVKAYDEWGTNRTDEFLSKKGSDPDGDFEQIENEDFEEPQTTNASTSTSFTEPVVEETQEPSKDVEQNQAEINAGSNVSAQMTEAAAQSSEEDSQQQLKNAFGSITESLAGIHSIIKQSIMDGTEHIYPEANRISDAAATRILIQKGLAADWNEGHGIVKGLPRGTDGFQHSNMTILSEFNNYLNKNLSSQETSGNTSEEELEAAKPTEETGTSSYTGPGSVPTQPRATYQSGGSLSWKDSLDKFNEWRAAKKVTYKDNGPAIRKIAKEIRAKSPGVVGHLLDLDDKFSSLTNNQRLAEDDPRKELVNNLRAAAMSIHSHISDKASSSPNELATELPQSLRADHLLNETPTIAKEADVGQPDKIDPNLWVTLSPDQKNHVKNYVRLHDKVQSFQLPNGQIAGSDESLSAYNELHNYRRKLETSFGATGASKVGNEKYDIASKKVFDLLKEYPLGIARVF